MPHVFIQLKTLNALRDLDEETILRFWIENVNNARNSYGAPRKETVSKGRYF